jgi:hypothetical protein
MMTPRSASLLVLVALSAAAAGAQAAAAGAQAGTDAKAVLYQVANAHGMLRGVREVDAITSQLFQGTGTMYAEAQGNRAAQDFRLTKYKAEVNYSYPGLRVDLERVATGAGAAAPERLITVVSGTHAWNEVTMPGGPATADKGTLNARLLEVWMLPHGVVKAALKAPEKVGVSMQNGARMLTIPLPAPLSGTLRATLNAKNQVAQVVATVQDGARQTVVETTYDDYKDPDMSDIPFPHRIVRRSGGRTILDLTITAATMYNPYVIMPVPDNIGS